MKFFPVSLSGAVAGLLVAAAAPAFADPVEAPANDRPNNERSGLVLGATIDGGDIGCQTMSGDDCSDGAHPAGGFSVHVGGMVTPTLAILGEAWAMAHTQNSLIQILATADVRGWVAPRLWLQGGIGVARSEFSLDNSLIMAAANSTVPAVVAAVGFELVRAPTFGLDLELRAGSGLYRDDVRIYNAALGVGATFF